MREDKFIVVRNRLTRSSIWPKYGGFFLDLVWYAVFRDTTVSYKGTRVPLAKGQCLVPMRFLEERWGVPKSTVHQWLKRFEREGLIRIKVIRICGTDDGTNRGTRVTIVNYSDYQSLGKHARKVRDADQDAGRDIEEGSMKKEVEAAVAPVARDRQNPTGPSGAGTPTSEPPPQVAEIIEVHRSITGQELRWIEQDVVDVTKLIDILGFPNARGRVELLAKRQMEKGNPPSRLGYYIKIIQEDSGRREPDTTHQRLRALTSGIGNGPVMSRPSHEATSPPCAPEPDECATGPEHRELLVCPRSLGANGSDGGET